MIKLADVYGIIKAISNNRKQIISNRYMSNHILSILALSALSLGTVAAQQRWNLEDCIDYALRNNIQVQQARLSAESSAVDVKQSRAAFFPSLTFSSSQQFGFQKVESQDQVSNNAMQKNPTYTGSYQLSASVALYDGGANYYGLKQSKIAHEANELAAQQTSNSIQEQIIQAYYQILYAHESVQTNEEIVAVAQQELDRTKARLDVGKGAKVDVAQMESQYQQNYYAWVNARNQEAANILALKQLLQLGAEAEFEIDYSAISQADVLAAIPTVAEAQQQAMNHLPDLRAAQLNVESARLQTKIAKAGYHPSLSLNAGVSTSNGNQFTGDFSEQIGDNMRGSLGLSLSVPIYDNRRTRSSVDKAKIQLSTSLLDQENTRMKIENTIATLHLDILSAQARYQSAVSSEAAARESFEIMDTRYGVGLESVVDLLTNKNQYLSARQETLQSKYTALMNLSLLDFYTGRE